MFFVGSLPISVQGLGTNQVLLLTFFAGWGPQGQGEAAVLAMSLVSQVLGTVVRMLIGVFFVRHPRAKGLTRRRRPTALPQTRNETRVRQCLTWIRSHLKGGVMRIWGLAHKFAKMAFFVKKQGKDAVGSCRI